MRFTRLIQMIMVLGLLSLGAPIQAGDKVDGLTEARIEGQLWATYALNQHLNPFDIDISVDQTTVQLEGEVDSGVKKDLAEQIALSVNGIENVQNRIVVNEELASSDTPRPEREQRSFGDRVSDATTTAAVKSKLLWNRNTAGLSIDVSTRNGVVELEGEAESQANRELAGRLAANTDGVVDVKNNIRVRAVSQVE